MNIGSELQLRANILASRKASTHADLVEQGARDEKLLLTDTRALDWHPVRDDGELYDGPCACHECLSYGA